MDSGSDAQQHKDSGTPSAIHNKKDDGNAPTGNAQHNPSVPRSRSDGTSGRRFFIIACVAVLVLTTGLFLGGKYFLGNGSPDEIALGRLPDPQVPTASSPECQKLMSNLPEDTDDLKRVTVIGTGGNEPPPSVAAWVPRDSKKHSSTHDNRLILRCGVALPEDFRLGAQGTEINGVNWFSVADSTSDGQTQHVSYYAIDRGDFPVVITTPLSVAQDLLAPVSTAIAKSLRKSPVDPPGGQVSITPDMPQNPRLANGDICRLLISDLETQAEKAGSFILAPLLPPITAGTAAWQTSVDTSTPPGKGIKIARLWCGVQLSEASSPPPPSSAIPTQLSSTTMSFDQTTWILLVEPYPALERQTWLTQTQSGVRIAVRFSPTDDSDLLLRTISLSLR